MRDDSSYHVFPQVYAGLSFCNLEHERTSFTSKDLTGRQRLQMVHDFNVLHLNCRAGFPAGMKNPVTPLAEISRTLWTESWRNGKESRSLSVKRCVAASWRSTGILLGQSVVRKEEFFWHYP